MLSQWLVQPLCLYHLQVYGTLFKEFLGVISDNHLNRGGMREAGGDGMSRALFSVISHTVGNV